MKLIALQIFLIFVLFSCGTSEKADVIAFEDVPTDVLTYDVIDRQVVAPGQSEDTMSIHVVYEFYETPTLEYQRTANRLMKEYFGSNWISEDSPVQDQMDKNYASAFVKGFETEYLLAKKDWEEMHPWEIDMDLRVDDKSYKNYIQCNFTNYSFTGGAHGNSNVRYYVIDKRSGKQLKLDEICTNREELNKRAEKYFREQNEIPLDVDLREFGLDFENDAFNVSENFIFNGKEITFFYNQYEIGPYSAGTFSATIPLDEIQDVFSMDFGGM